MTDIRGDKYCIIRLNKVKDGGFKQTFAQIKLKVYKIGRVSQKIIRKFTHFQYTYQSRVDKQLWPYNWKKLYRKNIMNRKI